MLLDADNPVVALCAAGMNADGDPETASGLFRQAWDAQTNDYEATIAAHFMARHQPTDSERLRWNEIAIEHARKLPHDQAVPFYPSLYLNVADSLFAMGRSGAAKAAVELAEAYVGDLSPDGYAEFVRMGIRRLKKRIQASGWLQSSSVSISPIRG